MKETTMKETLGKTIRRLRTERGYTQEDLAELLSVSPQTVSKWENDLNFPDISLIVPLANTLSVTTDTLFGLTSSTNEVVQNVCSHANSLWQSGDRFGAYKYLREELRLRPNCPPLLLMCLEYGRSLAVNDPDTNYYDANYYDADHAPEIYRECIKMASTFFEHAKDVDGILRAHSIMVSLHASHGHYDDAEEHAKHFPQRADMTIHSMRAYAALLKNDSAAVVSNLQTDFSFKFESVLDANILLATALYELGRYSDAITVCRFSINLIEQVFEEAPFVLRFWERECGNFYVIAAKSYLALGDEDSAIDILKEYAQHESALENLTEAPQFESALLGKEIRLFCQPNMFYIRSRRDQFLKALDDSAFDSIRNHIQRL